MSIKVMQYVYTSCRVGQTGRDGFQTYSMSEGLWPEEGRELEALALVRNSSSMPVCSGPADIEKYWPDSLAFFQLASSGRYGVGQTCYAGQDYTMRHGNYVFHAMVLPEGRWPFYPAWMAGHSGFLRRIADQDSGSAPPPPLPILDIASPAVENHWHEVRAFLANDRVGDYNRLLNVLIDSAFTRRRLVLRDTAPNLRMWIAAMQMAFPLAMAHGLTFRSPARDPFAEKCLLTGLAGDYDGFSCTRAEVREQFYVFDFPGREFSGPVSDHRYARAASARLVVQPADLSNLHAFLEGAGCRDISVGGSGLEAAMVLYSAIHEEAQPPSHGQVSAVLAAIRSLPPGQLYSGFVMERMEPWFARTAQQCEGDQAWEMIALVLEAAGRRVDCSRAVLAAEIFAGTSSGTIADSREEEILGSAGLQYSRFLGLARESGFDGWRLLLQPAIVDQILQAVNAGDGGLSAAAVFVACCRLYERTALSGGNEAELMRMLGGLIRTYSRSKSCSAAMDRQVIKASGWDEECKMLTLAQLLRGPGDIDPFRGAAILSEAGVMDSGAGRERVLQLLDSLPSGPQVLRRLFQKALQSCGDRVACIVQHINAARVYCPRCLDHETLNAMVLECWQGARPFERERLAVDLLHIYGESLNNARTIASLLKSIDDSVDFWPFSPAERERRQTVMDLARQQHLSAHLQMFRLALTLSDTDPVRPGEWDQEMAYWPDLSRLELPRYSRVLNSALNRYLPEVDHPRKAERLLKRLYVPSHEQLARDVLGRRLNSQIARLSGGLVPLLASMTMLYLQMRYVGWDLLPDSSRHLGLLKGYDEILKGIESGTAEGIGKYLSEWQAEYNEDYASLWMVLRGDLAGSRRISVITRLFKPGSR